MQTIRLYENDIENQITTFLTYKVETIAYFIPTLKHCFLGIGNKVDSKICKKNDCKILGLQNYGGVIVGGKDDINVAVIKHKENYHLPYMYNLAVEVQDYLINKGLIATIESNDILIDGIYKVGSFSSTIINGMIFNAFHLSYSVDIPLIKKICTKPMRKIPKGLSEYGISINELQDLVLNFLKNIK